MSRRKEKSGKLSVFKGREAKLNKAIFHILAHKSPQTIYQIYKAVRNQRGLKHTRYANVNKRIRALEKTGFIRRTGTKKTKAGFEAILYELAGRAYLAILFNSITLDKLIMQVDETTALAILGDIIIASAQLVHSSLSENLLNLSTHQ